MNGKTNGSIVPKKRGLLEKGKGLLKSLAEKPKAISTSDLKKDPWGTIKQLVKNVPYVLGHATSKIGTGNKIIK